MGLAFEKDINYGRTKFRSNPPHEILLARANKTFAVLKYGSEVPPASHLICSLNSQQVPLGIQRVARQSRPCSS